MDVFKTVVSYSYLSLFQYFFQGRGHIWFSATYIRSFSSGLHSGKPWARFSSKIGLKVRNAWPSMLDNSLKSLSNMLVVCYALYLLDLSSRTCWFYDISLMIFLAKTHDLGLDTSCNLSIHMIRCPIHWNLSCQYSSHCLTLCGKVLAKVTLWC